MGKKSKKPEIEKYEDLTLTQRNYIPLTLEVSKIEVEYADCGSHRLAVLTEIDLSEAQRLRAILNEIPGIDLEPEGN